MWRRDDYPWERNVWNYHPEVEIHRITNATGLAFIGDYIGEFQPGHLAVVGGGLPHDWVTTVAPGQRIEGRDVVLQFDPARLQHIRHVVPELGTLDDFLDRIKRGLVFTGETAKTAGDLLDRLGALRGLARLIGFLELLGLMAKATDFMLLSSADFAPKYDTASLSILHSALQYIALNYSRELAQEEVADHLGMTESQFSRFFKKNTGNTYSDYLTALRLNRACQLLADRNLSITDICFRAGYSNISNFNRRFREHYNMTPSDYRRLSEARQRLEADRGHQLKVSQH